MRARDDAPSLRVPRVFVALRAALVASRKDSFQAVELSVQRDRMHLVVEADDKASPTSGGGVQPVPSWAGRSPLPAPRTWLLRVGWRKAGGPLTPDDGPLRAR
jgi:hypothetical protein